MLKLSRVLPLRPAQEQEQYDRQVRAFGLETQRMLGSLTVAVVGVGGAGSLLVQGLAHLGVGRLILVHPDRVEVSNLNRLVGASPMDARRGRAKTTVAAWAAQRTNPAIRVHARRGNVLDPEVWRLLRSADVVIGAVDGHAPRWALNRLAVQYARCYLDVGVEIGRNSSGRLEAGGHVAVVRPGGPCLLCVSGYDPRRVAAELDPALVEARRTAGYRVDAPGEPTPSVLFLNQAVSALALGELVNWVSPWREPSPYLLLDLVRPGVHALEAERDPDCAACGPDTPRGLGDAGGVPDFAPPSAPPPLGKPS